MIKGFIQILAGIVLYGMWLVIKPVLTYLAYRNIQHTQNNKKDTRQKFQIRTAKWD